MKIAVLDPSLFTIPYDTELCNSLSDIGMEVHFFGRPLRHGENFELREMVNFVPYFYRFERKCPRLPASLLTGLKGVNHVLAMSSISKTLQSLAPDIIHFQWSVLPIIDKHWLRSLRKLAPLVLTVHDTTAFNGNPSSRFQGIGFRSLLKHFDHLVVHTYQGMERLLALGIPRERLSIIPHGLLTSARVHHDGPVIENEYPGTSDQVNFLMAGKIRPYKGVDVLIRAISQIPARARQGFKFVVAGKPYMKMEVLEKLVKKHEIEDTLSFIPRFLSESEMDDLFSRSSVLLFPYREIEASGILMRSLAFHKPVIASALGLFSELIEDGIHGRLVTPGDAVGLANAICELGTNADSRLIMGQNITALNRSIPTWREVAGCTKAVYWELRR